MQYKRFVSYVFQYENGKKGENIGFARVEFSDDKIMLNVHFRIRNCVNEWLQLYLFKNENQCLSGMPVGNGRMKWNTFDMQTSVTTDKMNDYDCLAEDLKGLYIQSETGKIFASVWDDGELPIEEFHPIQIRQDENVLIEVASEPESEGVAESVAETEAEIEEVKVAETEEIVEMKKDTEEAESVEMETDIKTEEITGVEADVSPEERTESEVTAEVKEMSGPEELLMVEKIDLRGLRRLAVRERGLGNNRFLLHGYYNYHYLYLQKINETQAILGVPGIFHPMEKNVAAMYGFDSFCPKDGKDIRSGVFGYWCRTVALDKRE